MSLGNTFTRRQVVFMQNKAYKSTLLQVVYGVFCGIVMLQKEITVPLV